MSAEPPAVPAGDPSLLAHVVDPDTPEVVTVYDPSAQGEAIATRWFTVAERVLVDAAAWR